MFKKIATISIFQLLLCQIAWGAADQFHYQDAECNQTVPWVNCKDCDAKWTEYKACLSEAAQVAKCIKSAHTFSFLADIISMAGPGSSMSKLRGRLVGTAEPCDRCNMINACYHRLVKALPAEVAICYVPCHEVEGHACSYTSNHLKLYAKKIIVNPKTATAHSD